MGKKYNDIAIMIERARFHVSNDDMNSFLLSYTRHIASHENRLKILVKGKESILKLRELFFEKVVKSSELKDSEDSLRDLQGKHKELKDKIEEELFSMSKNIWCDGRSLPKEEIQNHAKEIEAFLPSLYALSPDGRAAAKREELRLKLLGDKGKTSLLYQFLESNYVGGDSLINDYIIKNTLYILDNDRRALILLECIDAQKKLISLYSEILRNLESQENCQESQKQQIKDYEVLEASYKEEIEAFASQVWSTDCELSEKEKDKQVQHFVDLLNNLFEGGIKHEEDLTRRREELKSRINPYFIPKADGMREV